MNHFGKPVEETLRQGKTKDDSQYDGTCNLDCTDSILGEPAHVAHDEIVGSIVNSGTRHQRENAGQKINGNRRSAHGGEDSCNQRKGKGRNEIGNGVGGVMSNTEHVNDPSDGTGQTTEQ